MAMVGVCATILYFGLERENKRREAQYGPVLNDFEQEGIATGVKTRQEGWSTWQQDLNDEVYLARWGLTGMTKEEMLDLGDDHPAFRYAL
ncbi:hypothetical protein QFC22_001190 [Naganishia vaughanmartiniae]|uniref:Uncharacterized protein n=1 Tax=Naganishia vaughanmartiniae TaxID=1424756 RepID=A0ACC2XK46_9TREE|nr:hypothetical protein QFC22_001190 [Naganishia vaughanmartiniae]